MNIWLSVDPMLDIYPHQTSYAYCSNNPVNRVDPNGMADGNWYDLKGNLLWTDGIEDNKVFIVTDKKEVNAINKGTKTGIESTSATQIPNYEDRQIILNELKSRDLENPNAENGGFWGINLKNGQEEIRWGTQGPTGDPSKNSSITFNPNSINGDFFKVILDFHCHPSGVKKVEKLIFSWNQPPSPEDKRTSEQIQNVRATTANSIVFGMGNEKVYFYNSLRQTGSMSFKIFKVLK